MGLGGCQGTCDGAIRKLVCAWACSLCRAATGLPRTRLPSPAPRSCPLRSSSGPEPGLSPVSPGLAPLAPGGWPWWPRCLFGTVGAFCPSSGAAGPAGWSLSAEEPGLPRRPALVGTGLPQALARWDCGLCAKHFVRQSSFSSGVCELLGVLPQPCLSSPCQGGAHSLSWLYLFL